MGTPKQAEMLAARGYLTAADAARRIGVHVATMYSLCKSGKVEFVRVGRNWYVKKESLAEHLGPEAAALLGLTGDPDAAA